MYSSTAANDAVADRANTQTNIIYSNAVNDITLYSTAEIKANGTNGGYVNITAQAFNAQSGSLIQANGNNGPGGVITLTTSDVHLSGAISANGANGGSFALSAQIAQIDAQAVIQTNGSNGPGGHIDIYVSQDIDFVNSGLYANGTTDGGSIRILSRAGNLSLFNSIIQTNGGNGRGGSIGISAFNNTTLTNTAVEATGYNQGGHILIGNDAQNHALPFSIFTNLDTNSIISANQTNALKTTGGGFIETSGQTINLLSSINAGRGGMWLIDPVDITIDATFAAAIVSGLSSSNVVVSTTSNECSGVTCPSGSGSSGNIYITNSITTNTNNSLYIQAAGAIVVNGGVKIWLNHFNDSDPGTYQASSGTGSLYMGGANISSITSSN